MIREVWEHAEKTKGGGSRRTHSGRTEEEPEEEMERKGEVEEEDEDEESRRLSGLVPVQERCWTIAGVALGHLCFRSRFRSRF